MKNKQAWQCLEMLKTPWVSDALPDIKIDNERKMKSLLLTYSLLSAHHQRSCSWDVRLVVFSWRSSGWSVLSAKSCWMSHLERLKKTKMLMRLGQLGQSVAEGRRGRFAASSVINSATVLLRSLNVDLLQSAWVWGFRESWSARAKLCSKRLWMLCKMRITQYNGLQILFNLVVINDSAFICLEIHIFNLLSTTCNS